MNNKPKLRELIIHCSCGSLDHCIRFSYYEGEDELYIETLIDNQVGFWDRLWRAFKYVFRVNDCSVSDFVFTPTETKKFYSFIKTHYLKEYEE